MAAAEIETNWKMGLPSLEVVRFEATDTETHQSTKFRLIEGGIVSWNEDTDATCNLEDDDSSAINGAQDGVIINAPGASDVTMSIMLIGSQ